MQPQIVAKKEEVNLQKESLEKLQKELEVAENEGKKKEDEATIVKKEAEEQNETANKIAKEMEAKQEIVKKKLDVLKPNDVAEFKTYKRTEKTNKFAYFLCMLKLENPKPKPDPPKNPKDPNEVPQYNYFKHLVENYMGKRSPTEILNDLKDKHDKKYKEPKISHDQMIELQNALQNPGFNPSEISMTVQNIFDTIALKTDIFFINEQYLPLKKAAEEAETSLRNAETTLKEIQDKLAETRRIKKEKEDELEQANQIIQDLQNQLDKCSKRLINAKSLNSSLGDEKEDWIKKKKNLEDFSKNIVGDILISSGIIAYLGAFPKSYREEIIEEWAKRIKEALIPISYEENQNPNDIMRNIIGDEMEIESWKSQNLPNDNFSADNA